LLQFGDNTESGYLIIEVIPGWTYNMYPIMEVHIPQNGDTCTSGWLKIAQMDMVI
jgi:hypothetical protein